MGIGVSIFLIAVGAILTFAIDVTTNGFNINTIGIILMIVGAIGLLTSLIIWGPRRRSARAVTYDDGYAPTGGRRVVREESYRDTV
jgi:membrane-bound ClpP family serine protease